MRCCRSLTERCRTNLSYNSAWTQPQVTSEIGDTWIYGVASDPRKVAEYRELLRWRQAALPRYGDAAFARFDQLFLKLPEHTWSVSVQHLGGDITTYDNNALHSRVSELLDGPVTVWASCRAVVRSSLS